MSAAKRSGYYLNENKEYVIEDYNQVKPFASFLPSIAGIKGRPIWLYYANRGQAISSFGVNNKDYAIMEFSPANKAYRDTSRQGFRTFLKIKEPGKSSVTYYEPFQNPCQYGKQDIQQRMFITSYDIKLEEINPTLGIQINVMYCTLPGERVPALIRSLSIKNISGKLLEIEVMDGVPIIIPYFIKNDPMKNMSNLVQAWMRVENYETAPFYALTVLPGDTPETQFVEGGNFYLNFNFNNGKIRTNQMIINPTVIFENITDFSYPVNFFNEEFKIPQTQVNIGFIPCGFGYQKLVLEDKHTDTTYTLVGNIDTQEKLDGFIQNVLSEPYITAKIKENMELVEGLKRHIFTASNSEEFDQYCGQSFMDNCLRGGYPLLTGKGKNVFYVYSRKHGDMEREYNFFQLDSTYYSQGNSNFRDVNQNRRNDVFFLPYIEDTNIKIFFNLLQLDGFNPLILKGSAFIIEDKTKAEQVLSSYIGKEKSRQVLSYISESFTPGGLLSYLESLGLNLQGETVDQVLNELLHLSYREDKAEFGEGYWIDHWTYNNDLLEHFMAIFPEKTVNLLFDMYDFTYFDSYEAVVSRDKRYVLTKNGVRQYNSLAKIPEKEGMIKSRNLEPQKVRTQFGKGDVYKCNLIAKIVNLAVNKVASLDPEGVGIEMEANKPGWCDALNGLPGILGSSLNEIVELKRLAIIIITTLETYRINMELKIKLPEEVFSFFNEVFNLLKNNPGDYDYWDKGSKAKEEFRGKVALGISGKEEEISVAQLVEFLKRTIDKIDKGLRKAFDEQAGLHYTFFINEVTEYEVLNDANGNPLKNKNGYPFVRAKKFKQKPLPFYLEGPVHILRVETNKNTARNMYNSIKKTGLYDEQLGMYKVNVDITDVTKEIGRQSAFPRGWLENEAVFLHMHYKYLLELLRSGLYEEFFDTIKKALIPFQDPEIYGRSILENSSFIASTVYPDKKVHGAGYQARLTGASSEFLTMWIFMTTGKKPFYLDGEGNLGLVLNPVLPHWLFTEKSKSVEIHTETGAEKLDLAANSFAFYLLGKILTVYHNDSRKNTYGPDAAKISRIELRNGGDIVNIEGGAVPAPYAKQVRDGVFERIDVYFV